jgi:pyruvate,orthophosphate dikinase
VTIRLLDPPLHEFLPAAGDDIDTLAAALDEGPTALRARITALSESNPMLGHRGSRLAVTAPEIYDMQLRAIFAALSEADAAQHVEIMFPLITGQRELQAMIERVAPLAEAAGIERARYTLGAMIEVPRAALVADRLAQEIDFFSFGTNDLTQTTFGMSRDDAGTFLPTYVSRELLDSDPFTRLDEDGVGALMALAVEKGRSVKADLKLGLCGEHGGHPASIAFCQSLGLDYISCSPFRVPIARLAAAQAALKAAK